MSRPKRTENRSGGRDSDDRLMIDRLNSSFETFIGITEDLKKAYDRLRERADSMDLQLKDANRNLSEKVLELDGLSQRLNDLLQNMPGAVVASDGSGCITHFNRAAEKLLGMAADSVMGRRLDEVDALEEMLLLCHDPHTPIRKDPGEERTVVAPDGRRIVVTSRISELRTAQGEPAGWVEMLTDLTETDRLRREVHRLDTLAALGEMAAGVAHQIRNPLNGVEGFASLLQRSLASDARPGSDDSLRYAGKIVHGVREVNAIINGMLMLARNEKLEIRPVRLDLLAEEVVERLRQWALRAGI
ncbi:MAG: PAS domain S-box protein, partial [Planctomycetota bacterium]